MSYAQYSPNDIRLTIASIDPVTGHEVYKASVRLKKGWFETPSPHRVARLAFCQKHGRKFWLDSLMNVILSDDDEMLWKVSRP